MVPVQPLPKFPYSEPILNRPHALYYNDELIGIITNPDPHGNIQSICEYLSPDEGDAVAIELPYTMGHLENWGMLASFLRALEIQGQIPRHYPDEEQ